MPTGTPQVGHLAIEPVGWYCQATGAAVVGLRWDHVVHEYARVLIAKRPAPPGVAVAEPASE